MLLYQYVGIAAMLLFGFFSGSTAQTDDTLQQTKLYPFRVSFGPLTQELTYEQQLLVRSEIEQILSIYLKNRLPSSSRTTSVIFVAVPTIFA